MSNWKVTVKQRKLIKYDDAETYVTDTIVATGFEDGEEAVNFAEACLAHCVDADIVIENEKEDK